MFLNVDNNLEVLEILEKEFSKSGYKLEILVPNGNGWDALLFIQDTDVESLLKLREKLRKFGVILTSTLLEKGDGGATG